MGTTSIDLFQTLRLSILLLLDSVQENKFFFPRLCICKQGVSFLLAGYQRYQRVFKRGQLQLRQQLLEMVVVVSCPVRSEGRIRSVLGE